MASQPESGGLLHENTDSINYIDHQLLLRKRLAFDCGHGDAQEEYPMKREYPEWRQVAAADCWVIIGTKTVLEACVCAKDGHFEQFWCWTFKFHVTQYNPADFHPRGAISARVIAIIVCLCVCLSVCHTPVLYQNG